jgi:hypothetical protein
VTAAPHLSAVRHSGPSRIPENSPRSLILAGAILGAAWLLKPVPVEQVSQQRREALMRSIRVEHNEYEHKRCAAAIGKTIETLDRNDPAQEVAYEKCWEAEESRGRLERI